MRLGPVPAGPVHSCVGAAGRFAAVCCVRGVVFRGIKSSSSEARVNPEPCTSLSIPISTSRSIWICICVSPQLHWRPTAPEAGPWWYYIYTCIYIICISIYIQIFVLLHLPVAALLLRRSLGLTRACGEADAVEARVNP